MKKIIPFLFALMPLIGIAQSNTTNALQKRFADAFSLYFYKNTLRMLNQADNKEFDEMVKNIDKLKFLAINKSKDGFRPEDYKKLKRDYVSETYEEIMSSRYAGRNFDVYLRDKKGATLGTVLLVNDSTTLYVLDMLGTIDIRNASKLFSSIDENSEIGQKVKDFMKSGDPPKAKKEVHVD